MQRGVMFVAPWMFNGGIERVLEAKARWLAARGWKVEVLVWDIQPCLSGRPNPMLVGLQEAGIPVSIVPVRGRRFHLSQRAVYLAARALRGGFDVIVGHEIMVNFTVMLAKRLLRRHIRAIAEFHTSLKFPRTGIDARTLYRVQRLLRRADAIVTVSEGLRAEVTGYYELPRALVRTISNFFDIAGIRRLAQQATDLPIPGAPFILGCGRLVEMKAFDDLIKGLALARQRSEHRDLQLVILGDGPLQPDLERCAREHGVGEQVHFHGFLGNPWPYFARARALCLTSRYGEAFGRVLVEAMACGTPAIASRCHWGPDEVLEQGASGLLYEVGNVRQLADCIHAALADGVLRDGLIARGRLRSEEFDQDRVLPMLEECYLPARLVTALQDDHTGNRPAVTPVNA
jgi:glycosyltransferase involved in cell wall biosynthesis